MKRTWLIGFTGSLLLAGCAAIGSAPPPIQPITSPARTPVVRAPTAGTSVAAAPSAAPMGSADDVLVVLERNQCTGCHIIGERGIAGAGNTLNGLSARIASYNAGQDAVTYTQQALLEPGAFVAPDCPNGPCANIMPSYRGRLSDAEVEQIVQYLLSLSATP